MAYTFTVDGWQDWDGNRFEMVPDGDTEQDVSLTQGVFVHAWDTDDPESEHYFWVYVGEEFETWDEWEVLIGAMMDMHGMTMA